MPKNIFYILLIFIFINSLLWVQAEDKEKKINGAIIEFENDKFDFGDIEEGKVVYHVFKLTNVGNDTLRIKRVDGG